ncbi:MAG: hypothetical protein A3H52_03280 [Candidatus Zambryskibacteria bacterium RIFCSPLOWO2_02_FULL_39_26]|uniref:Bacterial spore germination immunoglobulin-like domain-containing protein n=1 Tax=Candidatus Zambryskibacteria bacterium RIFCSPLOWO2_12_FULL_39_23 TaxID=1802776 RepID=A0A1G2UU11_9BACT|nr:MAG: hypothetical protein A3H52_03280 [Candidatus Zambryskibacteria bacterium RIFCSPLOWO2_02_FULL_39_26]OHB12866.1 MAG: hypothetical protein A3G99_02240 [Candidatus Zambryskibacteria bacterium RIFCSPLOWO2_12_FULL_39_23]
MKSKRIVIIILIILAGLIVWFGFFKVRTAVAPVEESKITYVNASIDLIQVTLPFPDAVTGKEFKVVGRARGYWFFEASFPVEVLDRNGNSLGIFVAQAKDEWMTENFVPFEVDIVVPQFYIGPAKLVLKKDNPSGLSEYDASISFPINIEY